MEFEMGFFSFLNRNKDPLALLRQTVLALKGEKFDRKLISQTSDDQDRSTMDPENSLFDFTKKNLPANNLKIPIDPLKNKEEIMLLTSSLESLYRHLHRTQSSYFNSNLSNIAKKAHTLVEKMDLFMGDRSEKNLEQAQKAKNDFGFACILITKNNINCISLVGAILCAAAVLLASPLLIAVSPLVFKGMLTTGAIIGALAAVPIEKRRRNPIHEYTAVGKNIDTLLSIHAPQNRSSSNKYGVSDNNFGARLTLTHDYLTNKINNDSDEASDDFEPRRKSWLPNCCR